MATAQSLLLQKPSFECKNRLYHSARSPARASFVHVKFCRSFKKLSLKCFLTSNSNRCCKNGFPAYQRINKNGFGKMEIKQNPVEIIAESITNALKALQKPAAAAVVVGLLLMYDPKFAMAASGGRMGGSSFSSSSSSSSSSRSSSSSSSRSSFSSSGCSVSYSTSDPAEGLIIFAAFCLIAGFLQSLSYESSEKTSVLKLQVGLLGLGRSLQKDLNRIAETADTSTTKGLHYVLTETVLALLRHPDYFISACSSVDVKSSMPKGETGFNQLSIEERGKFDEETLVNVNNVKKQSSTVQREGGFSNEYIVITILVAARGELILPSINNSKDLKEALQKLASIPSNRTLAVEVLWTPQKEDDMLSKEELLEDYPLLQPL